MIIYAMPSVQKMLEEGENMAGNIVEGIFTGEGIGADKKGSEYCVMGLTQMLANSERYELRGGGDLNLKGTGTSTFPDLLIKIL